MNNYLIELCAIHVVLMLGYWLFLRKERQFGFMRLYLVGATLLSLLIPILKLPKLSFNNKPIQIIPIPNTPSDVISFSGVITIASNPITSDGVFGIGMIYPTGEKTHFL
ncbi:MAG: hypothetical protein AAFN93_24885 [Bacteroidota bacterium]